MPASIGVNLRVTGHCRQGGRKYMEDFFSVAYQQTEDERDLEYAFFGIYDGHGGAEAAEFAKERLMETIVRHRNFWSDNDEDVLRAIKMGYLATHYAMWKEQENWPRTASGLPSTAGTTASIAFIRRGKIYVGHVGDSAIVLGYNEPGCSEWKAKPLTRDHKPECANEMSRIQSCGGKVVAKSGVARVVWNRPRIGHKGPVRRSTPIDEIPFLAVARSLGDLWSYNSELDAFVVSPDPDCSVIPIDTNCFRCLIFGTDGLFNMLSPQRAVSIVQQAERHNEESTLSGQAKVSWVNPSKCLVEKALDMWSNTKIRADNTSVVTLMLDPPGPPRAEVLRNRRKAVPDNGLRIVTRYPSMAGGNGDGSEKNDVENGGGDKNEVNSGEISPQGRIQHKIRTSERQELINCEGEKKNSEYFVSNLERRRLETLVPYGFFLRTVPEMIPTSSPDVIGDVINEEIEENSSENIQINEVSSSSNEISSESEKNLRPKAKLRSQPFRRNRKRKRDEEINIFVK
ncbi:protein phosphatase 1D isoform X2 [Onthophagus taurus]|uniref:protein phosphatase 1D isoform X2 n=1 Tax=Onthophagus taurus TaxID=166361 RepID=UPI000C2004DA|nr:protein phosphatase 1D isoform X2 [Onthophagus taurus]